MATKKIIIAGDLFPVVKNLHLFTEGDAQTLFGKQICDLFSAADFRICNLEGALTDGNQRAKKTGPVITAPTQAVNAFKALGIDYCMLANNHITDGCTQGVKDTMDTLDKAGIRHIGAGMDETAIPHHVILPLGEKNVCIYNVSETMYNKPTKKEAGAWLYDEYVVCKEIEVLKKECDYIIVIYHGGIEKFQFPSPETRKRFHRMADSGADVVLSQHTHCIGCEENYNGAYLLYGQGDFLFNNFRPSITDTGLILEICFGEGNYYIKRYKSKNINFRLHLDEKQELSDFEERSSILINEEDKALQSFQDFCMKELRLYLTAFKSPSLTQRMMRKFIPSYYKKWLFKRAFKQKDLLFTLHTMRSEQNRETAIIGLQKMLGIYGK